MVGRTGDANTATTTPEWSRTNGDAPKAHFELLEVDGIAQGAYSPEPLSKASIAEIALRAQVALGLGVRSDAISCDLGDPTIIVNNAGANIRKAALDSSEGDFETTMRLNLWPYRGPSRAPYVASKSGVVELIKTLPSTLLSMTFGVNAMVPGTMETEIWQTFRTTDSAYNRTSS